MKALTALLLALLALGTGVLLALRPWEAGPVEPTKVIEKPALAVPTRIVVPLPTQAPPPVAAEVFPSPTDPWTLENNVAVEALEAGRLVEAASRLRECHRAVPDNVAFRHNLVEALVRLARALHSERDLPEALVVLEEALEYGHDRPDLPQLEALRDRWRTEEQVEENHWSESSDLFELSYDTDRRDILHNSSQVLAHLETHYEDLRLWFGGDPVRERGRDRIRVVLYNHSEFDQLTGLGAWAGGVFDGTVRVSVEDLTAGEKRWKGILTHELVHVFVQDFGGNEVPGWLNEGLAQIFEASPGRIAQSQRGLSREEVFSLETLGGSLATWKDSSAIARAYAQSLVFVDEIRRSQGDEGLRRMVVGCKDGKGPGRAFADWAGMGLEIYFEDWKNRLP